MIIARNINKQKMDKGSPSILREKESCSSLSEIQEK